MEAHALNHSAGSALAGRSPLLRLQSDEKLIALIRRGHHGAFDALFQRYQSRLLAFCRHMLGSTEDAEDVLQEVFTAAFNAMLADDRPINARPWLYRIARNRCLNHLRKPVAAGLDSMDVFERDGGVTTADTVHRREEFRQIVSDVQDLPETQRTALLLREIDALSSDQIAEAMDTTVPSVKSLLVRARVSLAEAAEARLLTCAEVRLELGQVAEGITKTTPPVRRHLKHCERCRLFRGELRRANRALAAVYPIGPLVVLKKLVLAKLGTGAAGGGAAAGSAAAGAGGAAAGVAAAGGAAAGGAISAGFGAVASKAVAGMAAVTIVTAGAVEVKKVTQRDAAPVATAPAAVAPATPSPSASAPAPAVVKPEPKPAAVQQKKEEQAKPEPAAAAEPAPVEPAEPAPAPAPAPEQPAPTGDGVDEGSSTTTLPPPGEEAPAEDTEEPPPPPEDEQSDTETQPTTPPGEAESSPAAPQPAPVAGEPKP